MEVETDGTADVLIEETADMDNLRDTPVSTGVLLQMVFTVASALTKYDFPIYEPHLTPMVC